MAHNATRRGARPADVTVADLEEELRRLLESKIVLVALAGRLGLAAPGSCCTHEGQTPCLSCASDWLVARVRFSNGALA